MPHRRYRAVHDWVDLPLTARTWPQRRLETAPLWVPVDLRDGNQALAEPMDTTRKRRMFDLLVAMGFKEIEVGYPSASQTDFDFVRHLATSGDVPDDVTISVFTAARQDLIDRTVESIAGLPRTLIHLYTATAPAWRSVVLGRDRDELHKMIRESATHVMRRAPDSARFEFSPEVFNLTEPDYVLEICNGLTELWDASPDRPVVHNLPATVEIATPNVYADQIEYMSRHLERRDAVILSVHPHNDRGTGVACAELAVLAGAQRVEGCLFGNGERTGNVDLVTLALNLYAQGVNPMIDFSDIDVIREVVEHCNRIPVHPRHPYGGDLVHTAFSGTHQDAIAKGLIERAERGGEFWEVPYLPIDPADVGRTYEEVIRINSQSGKGGIAHLLRVHHGLDLPPAMRPDFARAVQRVTDATGRELGHGELLALFDETYVRPGHTVLSAWTTEETTPGEHHFHGAPAEDSNAPADRATPTASSSAPAGRATPARSSAPAGNNAPADDSGPADGSRPASSSVVVGGAVEGVGNGPLAALADALGIDIRSFAQHSVGSGPESPAVAYAECRVDGVIWWGAGRDTSVLTASVQAVLAAVARARA
ncbi:2-isopropylmalate synthase [Actinoplanes sp. NPDC051851]|uniref:2-isopropylmalate synthase n=1 Tax=Actinoplanes sp. NPDC051851 TaxID=3154753 RepID=UPI003443AE2A